MCGIAGFFTNTGASRDNTILKRMTSVIEHRGPDEFGFFSDQGLHLGHRRLSIVDLASGQQPMTNEDRSLWITYNGEIFNHASLRPELEQAGHRYQTHCDTETILHAYEQYGPDCLARFRGMFAFAIWDQKSRSLFAARDRLGIKPFYYYWDGRLFAFASEIKALLEHPDITTQLEETVLPEYLALGYVSEERTLFRNIRRLMPGHYLRLDARSSEPSLRIERYWDVPVPESDPETHSDQEWITELRRRLEETVRMRLMADVPLGIFLSGGVDSSAIAALVRQMTGGPVKTFSVGYNEQQYSELSYAAEVARLIGTDHHEVTIGMEEFFDSLPSLIWHEDEPITWPSSVSLHCVARLAASQVKVVLTGEGSDELFGGYERYRWTQLNMRAGAAYNLVPASVRRLIRSQLTTSPLLKAELRRKISHTVLGREATIESLYLDNFCAAFSQQEQSALLSSPPEPGLYSNFLRYWNAHPGASFLRRLLYADQKTYLVELLMKQDQMSMSASIESRVPLLDHTLVEFAMRVPDRLKIQGNTQKYIFKKAVEDLLPREIIHRRKMGFPTPLRQWLLSERAQPLFAALTDRNGFLASYLDLDEVERLIQRHRAESEDNTDRIWRLLNLQIWGDVFITGRRDRWLSDATKIRAVSS